MNVIGYIGLGMLIGAVIVVCIAVISIDEANQERTYYDDRRSNKNNKRDRQL